MLLVGRLREIAAMAFELLPRLTLLETSPQQVLVGQR